MITFNNIVERFGIFAENHFFIKSFSFGSPDDVDLSKFEEFPLMHLVYTGATYEEGTKTYNLEVYILDLPHDKKGKVVPQKQAISDSEQCAEDIIADIKSGGNIFLFAQDYEVVNATTTPLEEETKNVLSGILLDLSVAIPYEWDACNAPIDGVAPGGGEVVYARRGVLRMLTLDGATDVQSVRTIKVTNGTLTDDGDGVVTLDTGGVETLEALTDVTITNAANGQVIKYLNGIWVNAADGGAISLNDLTDVIISQPSTGEFFRYDGNEWVNDSASKSDVGLNNVDNTSDANKPISTATQTALDAKPNSLRQLNDVTISAASTDQVLQYDGADWVNATFSAATSLNDLTDVSLAGIPANESLLIYNNNTRLWSATSSQRLPSDGVFFHQRYETESEALRAGATATTELYFTCTADGNGLAESASSDTPTAGNIIKRKIYYSEEGFADPDTGTWVEFTPAPADDASFATVKAALLENLKARTGGTVPISLKQTWEDFTPVTTLLDSYPNAAGAWSLRLLRNAYTGSAIRVRRDNNDEQDIGFVSGELDTVSLLAFAGASGNAWVKIWYDQSTNGVDLTNTANARDPQIVASGTVIVDANQKPAIQFSGVSLNSGQNLYNTSGSFVAGLARNDFAIVSKNSLDNRGIFTTDTSPRIAQNMSMSSNFSTLQFGSNTQPINSISGSTQLAINTQYLFAAEYAGTDLSVYLNGSVDGTVSHPNVRTGSVQISIGTSYTTSYGYFDGKMQEVISYQENKSAVRSDIENNMNSYYSIYS